MKIYLGLGKEKERKFFFGEFFRKRENLEEWGRVRGRGCKFKIYRG